MKLNLQLDNSRVHRTTRPHWTREVAVTLRDGRAAGPSVFAAFAEAWTDAGTEIVYFPGGKRMAMTLAFSRGKILSARRAQRMIAWLASRPEVVAVEAGTLVNGFAAARFRLPA